ncbi:MAG: hypothetical protein RPU60_04085 [Candidatus Sedimenticola sp. (ex Thyasira tokunagai)]
MAQYVHINGLDEAKAVIKGSKVAGYKALGTSINRTATHTRSQVSTKAREKTTVKAKYAKKGITIPYRATSVKLHSKVVISGKRIPLIGYATRQTKKGVSGRIYKSEPIILRPRAFIATMKSGHKGVFWRKKRTGGAGRQGDRWAGDPQAWFRFLRAMKQKYPNSNQELVRRLGITELAGPALPDLIKDKRVWGALAKEADVYLLRQLDANLAYYLSKV